MKRLLSVFLVFVMIMVMIPPTQVGADYVGNGSYRVNGVIINADDYASYDSNCWSYATQYYKKVWNGKTFNSSFNDPDNMLRNLSDSQLYMTPEHLRAYITAAPLGSVIRMCSKAYLHGGDGSGHSQFLVDKTDEGFTVFEGNMPGHWTTTYTWESWVGMWLGRHDREYIKYIKYPGAKPYNNNLPSEFTLKVNESYVGFGSTVTITTAVQKAESSRLVIKDSSGAVLFSKDNPASQTTWKPTKSGPLTIEYSAKNKYGSASAIPVNLYVDCYHTFGEAVTAREESCYICPLENETCSKCGFVRSLPHSLHSCSTHQYGPKERLEDPTCMSVGADGWRCKECGFLMETAVLPALGHDVIDTVVPASCTAFGYTMHSCSRCELAFRDTYTDMLDHNWSDEDICLDCGAEMPEIDPAEPSFPAEDPSEPAEDPVHIHAFETCTEASTCSAAGYVYSRCECGLMQLVEEVPVVSHDYSRKVITAASPVKCGAVEYTCRSCGYTYNEFVPASCEDNPFADVNPTAFYANPVKWALRAGVTVGVSAESFAPNATASRAEFVTFLWRANGSPKAGITSLPFVDAAAGSYYFDALLWAYERGIINGTDATHFSPKGIITRSQVVTMLWREEGEPGCNGGWGFSDVKSGSYYYQAVMWAENAGIAMGVGNDRFAPNDICTRSQVVTFLQRTIFPHM